MAAANRIVVPRFSAAPPSYDQLDQERFRRLVRDGFVGVDEYVQRAIAQYGIDATPTDGDVLTWNGTTMEAEWQTP